MTSREVDRAASQLEHLHRQRRARLLSSVAAAGLAAGTLVLSNALAISVACGVASLLLLALVDTLRRRELIARLALDPHAYSVPDVRRYGHELVVLRAPDTRAEPTSVALCWQLLRSAAESPLYNWHLPPEDLGLAVRRIRAGIRRSPATGS